MKSVLSSAFTYGVERGLLKFNPCRDVEVVNSQPRERYVTDEEFEGVKKLATPRVRLAMDLACSQANHKAGF
jgi:hypothetical protein